MCKLLNKISEWNIYKLTEQWGIVRLLSNGTRFPRNRESFSRRGEHSSTEVRGTLLGASLFICRMADITVSEVLTQQLNALCLKSFPCGSGYWNKPHPVARKAVSPDTYWESDDPEEESPGALKDLLTQRSSPWDLDDNCSPESQHIRELAVTSPEVITEQFIYSYFRSVRVVDQEVTEVDAQLLKFQNLEELVLSANKLRYVNSVNLPRTLKVLELCSNHISSLKDLSSNPPPLLQHLGLAYNRIWCSSESTYLTAELWPNLISLDLSWNDLTDLFDLVHTLTALQQLRILVLQGNPLTLFPAYRGYTIDSLQMLCVLDDVSILPDEKHKFSGVSQQKDSLENKAKLFVCIGKVQGIPNPITPTEQQNPGEYPVTTINYHVDYEFIEDWSSRELIESQVYMSTQPQQLATERSVQLSHPLSSQFHTGLYKTGGLPWAEMIDFEYVKEHTAADLLALKYFLLSGMTVTITEEKILSWPQEPEQNDVVSKFDKKGTENGKTRSSSRGSKAGSKIKKKKENLHELRHDPPISRTLGSVIMPLKSIVSGEMQTFSVCNFGILCTNSEQSQYASDKDHQNSNKPKDRKLKSGRESAEPHKTSGSSSAKVKRKDAEVKPTGDYSPPQPIPLTIEIEVQLTH
ncbi:leucine-rich repeat-containing protein 43 [Mixophyes fleayi]|uniref:leucine-rich repeat-containing protein 43 n=1 Tax=Mixophyes fleayi TaxID=3061075 RepID=UPI003F4DBE5C